MQPRVENDEKLQSEENKRQGGIRKGMSFSRGTDKVGTESILDACPYAHTFNTCGHYHSQGLRKAVSEVERSTQ